MSKLCHRTLAHSWEECMIATEDEIAGELKRASSRPGVKQRREQERSGHDKWKDIDGTHLHALTASERGRLEICWTKYPTSTVDLKHDPSFTVSRSRGPLLPTLIKGMGVTMCPHGDRLGRKRWLHSLELLSAMGYAITEAEQLSVSYNGSVKVQNQFSHEKIIPSLRTRASTVCQCGNTYFRQQVVCPYCLMFCD